MLGALDAAGLDAARHHPATFSHLTAKPVSITGLLRKHYFRLDEQGSEAAALTASIGRAIAAAPATQTTVSFDKPFIFALRDRTTGLVRLAGYISKVPAEPSQ